MKIITLVNILLSIVFILFVAVQYNDPDPIIWILAYGFVALILAFGIFKKFSMPLIMLGMIVLAVGTVYLLPSVFDWLVLHNEESLMQRMSDDKPYLEESRECLGLLLAFLALLYQYFVAKKFFSVKIK